MKKKIVFFGLGSIGQRHAKILKQNKKLELFAFRNSPNSEKNCLNIAEIFSWEEFEKLKPDVAFITNPTSLHIDTAIACAKRNCHLFIEKPLGCNFQGLKKLLFIINKNNLTAYVAYNLRFDPVILKLKEYLLKYHFLHMRVVATSYLPCWRPHQDYKKSYSGNSKMGGGVIFDLSHEIDYISYLLGGIKKISGRSGIVSGLTTDAEDYADMLITTPKGDVNVHVNFLSHIKTRIIRIDFKEISVVADLINHTICEYREEILIKKIVLDYKTEMTYIDQSKYFFKNINNPDLMNNVNEASKLFKTIVAFKQKSNE